MKYIIITLTPIGALASLAVIIGSFAGDGLVDEGKMALGLILLLVNGVIGLLTFAGWNEL